MWLQEDININQYDDAGKRHGFWKNFMMHSDKVASEESYLHGVRHGFCRYFWNSGDLRREGFYYNDNRIGLWSHYINYNVIQIIYIK